MNALEEIYYRIGNDMVIAARRDDRSRIALLVALVIALEKVYPEEMEKLRGTHMTARYDEPLIVKKTEKRLVRKLERPEQPELDEGEPFPRWFAVMCQPRREEDADRNLRLMRYHTFFPHMRKRLKIGRLVTREVITPLFARYLFIGVRRGMGLYNANEAVGVSTVVYLGGDPLEIPGKVMTEIMGRCDGDGDEISPELDGNGLPIFGGAPGDSVRLGAAAGAFQGLILSILRVEGSRVILDWVNGELGVPLDQVAELMPAKRRKGA